MQVSYLHRNRQIKKILNKDGKKKNSTDSVTFIFIFSFLFNIKLSKVSR